MYLVIYLLVLISLLLLVNLQSKVLLTPQFGFVACFIPQAIYCLFYIQKWNLVLAKETFFILVSGPILFVAFSFLFSFLAGEKNRLRSNRQAVYKINKLQTGVENPTISIKSWKLVIMVLFQSLTFLLIVRFITSLASGGRFATAIYYFRHTNLFTEDVIRIPSIVRAMRTFSIASGYIWSYLLMHSLQYKDKINRLSLIINLGFSILNNILLGARTGIMMILVSMLVQYYYIRAAKVGWKKALSYKTVLKILLILTIFIATFQSFAELIGRTGAANYTFVDYIAGYLAAEIKNLNSFVQKGIFGTTIDNNQSINGIVTLLAQLLNRPEWIHKIDLPFIWANGYNFGNLYTIYYPFVYDLGIPGIFIYIPIMAIICQVIYQKTLQSDCRNKISLFLTVYSYIYFAIIFSFFSNKFYDQIANTKFLWTFLSWAIIIKFLEKSVTTRRRR